VNLRKDHYRNVWKKQSQVRFVRGEVSQCTLPPRWNRGRRSIPPESGRGEGEGTVCFSFPGFPRLRGALRVDRKTVRAEGLPVRPSDEKGYLRPRLIEPLGSAGDSHTRGRKVGGFAAN